MPAARMELYDIDGYRERFYCPERMWEAEMERARPVLEWPTDGIPTVRPNLGTVFMPSIAGQGYHIQDGQMPWPGNPLEPPAIRTAQKVNVAETELMRLAAEFYRIHYDHDNKAIVPYQPDTQGVFDIAHLLYGDAIFYDMASEEKKPWVDELLEICMDLTLRSLHHLKQLIGEEDHAMVHGHGTPQGVYFPNAGLRMSEDTATLVSPEMIRRFILPFIEKASRPFGGTFIHYCGLHKELFEQLCRMKCVQAIDLGNPEMYDTRWLMERCAETDTVLYSRIAAEPGETWKTYTERLGSLVKQTGARCILRPLVFPNGREECATMCDLWHELTV